MSRSISNPPAYEYVRQKFQSLSTRKGFAEVLDAVATVLVRQPENEVISVGMQRYENNKDIGLVVAPNRSIPVSTVAHAFDLWEHLQCLGKLVEETLLQLKARKLSFSHWQDRELQLLLRVRLLKAQVYAFCLPGVFSCLRTRDGRDQAAVASFSNFVSRHPSSCSMNSFARNLGHLSNLVPALHSAKPLESDSLDTLHFVNLVDNMLIDIDWLHDNPGLYKSSSSRYFICPSFETFVDNLAAVNRAVTTLTQSIGHRKLYREYIRNKKIRVEIVPRSTSARQHIGGTTVHPECAMAIHLLRSGIPSTSYIGQSRYHCFNCMLFLRTLRYVCGSIFKMRKHVFPMAYFDWQYPEEELARSGLSSTERRRIYDYFNFAVGYTEEHDLTV